MSDDAILGYVKSIDERTARMETAFATSFQQHQKEDKEAHEKFDGRLKSLENSRTATRAGMVALTLGGTTAGAKAGLLDKLIGIWGGGS